MGMATPGPVTYVVWTLNGKEVHREPLTTHGFGDLYKKLAILHGAPKDMVVTYETVDPMDFRPRAERRGNKRKKTYGPNRKWWNNR
jgi:hypothetical protein